MASSLAALVFSSAGKRENRQISLGDMVEHDRSLINRKPTTEAGFALVSTHARVSLVHTRQEEDQFQTTLTPH
jgi:hypothetical protein